MSKLTVVFDADKERNLKCGFNQMALLEKELGKPLTEFNGDFKLQDMITMFYCFLKWEDKTLTHEIVGEIMDSALEKHGMDYVNKKLEETMSKLGGTSAIPSE